MVISRRAMGNFSDIELLSALSAHFLVGNISRWVPIVLGVKCGSLPDIEPITRL
jgi:hypothetical protein